MKKHIKIYEDFVNESKALNEKALDYEGALYSADEWMPDDRKLREEYWEIADEMTGADQREELESFFRTHADEEALAKALKGKPDWKQLAKAALEIDWRY